MAKRKEITIEEFNSLMKPGQELSWGDTSPFTSITTPPEARMVAWHASFAPLAYVGGANATMYIARSDSQHLNFDVYSIRPEDSATLIAEICYEPYHKIWHFNEIPEFLRIHMPEHIKQRFQDFQSSDT